MEKRIYNKKEYFFSPYLTEEYPSGGERQEGERFRFGASDEDFGKIVMKIIPY